MAKKTPEQIAAMEEEVRQFRAEEAREAAEARRQEVKPILDFIESDAFREFEAKLPELEQIAIKYREIRVHFDALHVGVNGLAGVRAMFPAVEQAEQAAPAPVPAPSAQD